MLSFRLFDFLFLEFEQLARCRFYYVFHFEFLRPKLQGRLCWIHRSD